MNSNLQSKLQEFRATPPDGVWSKIADALDEGTVSQRLSQYEENPPATAWQAIENSLTTAAPEPAKEVPFTIRFRKPLRYAAAACFLAVILVTVTLTVRRTEAGAIDAGSKTTVPAGNTAATTTASEQNALSPQQENSTAATETSETTTAKGSNSHQPKNARASYASLNEYVFFRDGDGKMRKVAKKLAGFVNCKDGDSNCQQRLQLLRQKMAANAMTTDFTGILDMLRQLQQKP